MLTRITITILGFIFAIGLAFLPEFLKKPFQKWTKNISDRNRKIISGIFLFLLLVVDIVIVLQSSNVSATQNQVNNFKVQLIPTTLGGALISAGILLLSSGYSFGEIL